MIPPPPDGCWTEAEHLLAPAAQLLDGIRLAIGVAALAGIVLLAGALLERHLIKRRLQVIDGGIDVDPEAHGRRA